MEKNEYDILRVCVCSLRDPVRIRFVVIRGLSGYTTIFPYNLINGMFFENTLEHKICVLDFLYTFCVKHFSFCEEISEIWSKLQL
jgi:hypothetical protein